MPRRERRPSGKQREGASFREPSVHAESKRVQPAPQAQRRRAGARGQAIGGTSRRQQRRRWRRDDDASDRSRGTCRRRQNGSITPTTASVCLRGRSGRVASMRGTCQRFFDAGAPRFRLADARQRPPVSIRRAPRCGTVRSARAPAQSPRRQGGGGAVGAASCRGAKQAASNATGLPQRGLRQAGRRRLDRGAGVGATLRHFFGPRPPPKLISVKPASLQASAVLATSS